jgi:hypothetical protein
MPICKSFLKPLLFKGNFEHFLKAFWGLLIGRFAMEDYGELFGNFWNGFTSKAPSTNLFQEIQKSRKRKDSRTPKFENYTISLIKIDLFYFNY